MNAANIRCDMDIDRVFFYDIYSCERLYDFQLKQINE